MTGRYKLELYIIRDNELEFALYDKEAETSQGTTKMIEKKLNRQDERIKELEEDNHDLKFELSKHVGDGEWDIRDITCGAGKFRLEEWGERYHQFYDGDTELEDETVVGMLLENENLIEELKKENKRMTNKLNELALEFLNYGIVTMGKATEISEMCYYDFLKYRKENGNPMELQL